MSQTQLKTISWPHSAFRAYNERNTSSLSPMEPEALDTNDLVALVQVATYWRLRLRNVAPETNKALDIDHPDFLQPESAEYSTGEKRFYECMERIQNQILNAQVTLKDLPLESLLPLAALLRIVLDNRHLNTNDFVGIEHPNYYLLNTPTGNRLDVYWHRLNDHIGQRLQPRLDRWITAPWIKARAEAQYSGENYRVTLEQEELDEALCKIWRYLSFSLKGQPTDKGKDCVFNPHYRQMNGQATVIGWLGTRLYGAAATVARKRAKELRRTQEIRVNPENEDQGIDPLDNLPANPLPLQWWEPIQAAVEGPYAEELQNMRPRKLNHINAQQVILKRLPPNEMTYENMAKEWNCAHTTIARFYNNHCAPWLREHFPELQDLLY